MPIYEYQCLQCNEKHEIIQRYSETPLEHCPKCGGEMKKLISSPAIQFKGSGFYKTDYPSSSSSAGTSKAASDAKADSKSDSKSESKSETKSESKSESSSATPAAAKSESKASD
jgi:putative FmdB family regulatory protein